MATKYVEEYPTEAAFLADAVDAPGKLGIASVGEKLVLNKSGSVVEVIDETATQTLTNKTLTSPTIAGPILSGTISGGALEPTSVKVPTETLAAAEILTAADTGKTLFLAEANGFQVTLPAVAAGLRFRMIVAIAPTEGNYTIVPTGGGNIFYGNVGVVPVDDAGIRIAAQDTINLVEDKALIGDWLEFVCDGTNWYVTGIVNVVEALTVAQS